MLGTGFASTLGSVEYSLRLASTIQCLFPADAELINARDNKVQWMMGAI